MRVERRVLSGIGAGAAATVAMSAFMLAARRLGLMGELPPKRITERVLDSLRVRRSERAEGYAAAGAHLGFGMAAGTAYGLLAPHVRVAPPLVKGAVFGALVWAGSYFGWVPALGLMPQPPKDRPGRPTSMLLAHLVFGGVLAGTLASTREERGRARQVYGMGERLGRQAQPRPRRPSARRD